MGILQIENDVERAIKYREQINPYNTNLSADLDELGPEKLAELKGRQGKLQPVLVKRGKKPTKGILKLN